MSILVATLYSLQTGFQVLNSMQAWTGSPTSFISLGKVAPGPAPLHHTNSPSSGQRTFLSLLDFAALQWILASLLHHSWITYGMRARGQPPSAINNARCHDTQRTCSCSLLTAREQWNYLPMGRKDSSPKVTQSSIALLQERFRQLQRVKERREEREQQRASCERPAASPSAASGAARPVWFNHPDLVPPARPPLSGSPSCWLSHHGGDWTADLQALEASLPVIDSPVAPPSEPDVDTTLHL